MIGLDRWIERIAADLDSLRVRYALVGGLAVGVRSEPRFTRDIDFALAAASDADAEALVGRLLGMGYGVVQAVAQTATGRLATMRLVPPGRSGEQSDRSIVVDLIFASSGIEPEVVSQAETLPIVAGVNLPVARVEHLIAMKVLSISDDRPQDLADLKALILEASAQQMREAAGLVRLIEQRGYHRGRDLTADLDSYLRRFSRREA